MAARRYDADSEHVQEVMRKDAARIQRLWAAAKQKYDSSAETQAAAKPEEP